MIRTVRSRLTLWYVGGVAVILCLFSAVFYVTATLNLVRNTDRMLALQAEGVAETIVAFWRAERAAAGGGPGNWLAAPSDTFKDVVFEGGLPFLISRWAEKTGNLDTDRPIRLLDAEGRVLGTSPSFTQLTLPLPEMTAVKLRGGHSVYQTFKLPDRRIRLVTHPIPATPHVLYVVQVAAGLDAVDASLARWRVWLLVLIPLLLAFLTHAVGRSLVTTVLSPIGALGVRSRQFVADNLHESVAVPEAGNELEQLDQTLHETFLRFERAFRRLRQFSAAASHELRTPLTVMKGEIGLALRKPRSAHEYRRVLQAHLAAVDELASTVDELLMLAQGDAVEGETAWRLLELGAMVARTRETLMPLADAKAIQVDVSVRAPLWVRGDARLLERVIANLLDNAMKYTPDHGRVTILGEPSEQEVVLSVGDTGPGIPSEQIPELFDQFFKRRPRTDGIPSTGLGLGLCRWIVETHHGHLDVTSVPGQGAAFTVRLPRSAPPA